MKQGLLKSCTIFVLIAAQHGLLLRAQTVSTFESLVLTSNTYWDGSSSPLGTTFSSGNAIFPNNYDTAYGGFWSSGWAYSNKKDSTTAGYTNMYSARTAIGYNGSANYIVGKSGAKINLNSTAFGKVINGFYVTNGTYAAISMKDGDTFSKKFGGVSGNDPDWFKLTVRKWSGGVLTNDSVEFYLADYRFTNNAQDYIVKTWQWVDLTSLGNVDSLKFILSSSDVGTFGMNTPAFFCVDNFTTADSPQSVQNVNSDNTFSVYPNPAADIMILNLAAITDENVHVRVTDVAGNVIYEKGPGTLDLISLDVSKYPDGIYFINISGGSTFVSRKFIKE